MQTSPSKVGHDSKRGQTNSKQGSKQVQAMLELIPTLLGLVSNLAWVYQPNTFHMHVDSVPFINSKHGWNHFQASLDFIVWFFNHTCKQIQARLEASPSKVGINSNFAWACFPTLLGISVVLAWNNFQPCLDLCLTLFGLSWYISVYAGVIIMSLLPIRASAIIMTR